MADDLWERPKEDYCELWRLAIERQERDLETGHERGLIYREEAADHVIDFFNNYLRHSKGRQWAGKPFDLEFSQEHHRLRPVFGWYKPDFEWDRTKPFDWDEHPYDPEKWVRRFNVAYVQLPKGTGKSTEAAGIGSYLLHEGEPTAEIYSAGAKKEQAKLVHEEAKRMHENSPRLKKFVEIVRDNISVPSTYSKWECFSKQAKGSDGVSPHGAICDEIHQWSWSGKEILNILIESARTKRLDPLIWMITTAGEDKTSLCYEYRIIAEKILRGIINDDSFFALICEPTRQEIDEYGWDNPKLAYLVNPGFNITVKNRLILEDIESAKVSPLKRTAYKRYRLNMWVGEQKDKMLDVEKFRRPPASIWRRGLKNQRCWLGVDMSQSQDITALVAVFPDFVNDWHYTLEWFWVPEENVAGRVERDNVPYDQWIEEGHLIATPGNWVHYSAVKQQILWCCEEYDVEMVCFDAWNTGQLGQELQDDHGLEIGKINQGVAGLNDACKFMQRINLSSRWIHNQNLVTIWMVSNCIAYKDINANIKPDKSKSEEKIDFVSACATACHMVVKNEAAERFIYDTVPLASVEDGV